MTGMLRPGAAIPASRKRPSDLEKNTRKYSLQVAAPPPPTGVPATTHLQMYACVVGLIISSGTDTCGGSVATNSTALATSSGFIIFARCSAGSGMGRVKCCGVSIAPG